MIVKMKKYTIYYILSLLITVFLTNSMSVKAQRTERPMITIESVITDQIGNPIPGAIIYGRGGGDIVVSDENGAFSITIPVASELRVEADGFYTKIFNDAKSSDEFILDKALFLTDENNRIHIPFGETTQRELTGAVSTISVKEFIRYDNTQSVYDAITGRISGVLGSSNIRGIGNALFIVDGIQRDPSSLNMEEVEQISVLKDAHAAMLYGTYAKNGVILITTKRGEAFKRKMNVTMEQGLSIPLELPKYLNSADYMELYNEALSNDGLPERFTSTEINKYKSGSNPYRYPDVDYYSNEFLKNFSDYSKLFGEFSGGNRMTQYYANIGWTRNSSLYQLGSIANSGYNRFNVRGNVDFRLNDYISSYVDAVVIFEINKYPHGNFWNDAATLHPYYYSPLLPVGLISNEKAFETAKRVKGDYILGGTSQYLNNVYGNMLLAGYRQDIHRTAQFNTGVNFDLKSIVQGLQFKTYLSFDIYNKYEQNVKNEYAVYQPTWNPDEDKITAIRKHGIDKSTGDQNLVNGALARAVGFYGSFHYQRTFNDVHNISGMLIGYHNSIQVNNVIQDERFSHLGLRLVYNFDKKLFADFTGTLPYSVKLDKAKKVGFSPSLGIGWIVKDSDSSNSILDYLKLRVSAGMILNDLNIGYFNYNSIFRNDGSFGWNDGTYSTFYTYMDHYANPNLGFEKMQSFNLGAESFLFNKSLYADLNIFYSRDADKVTRRTNYYPGYLGAALPYENFGINSYSGFDLGLMWNKNIGNLLINIGANLLYSKSQVVKIDELWTNDYQYRKGKSTTAIFGLESVGLFRDMAEIENSPEQRFGEVAPGDIRYKDQNNDGIVDNNDQIMIGNRQAPFSYGLQLKLRYKNITFFTIGNGRSHYDIIYNNDYYWVDGNKKYSKIVLNRWRSGAENTATYPRLTTKAGSNNFRNSTFWLTTGRYFSLSQAQLTYDMKGSKIGWKELNDFSIFLRGTNLFMISPEAKKLQLNIASEPQTRNVALGIRMIF